MSDDEYTTQYAIRLPNGKLHAHNPGHWTIQGGVIIYGGTDEDEPPQPVVYNSRENAEYALKAFQEKAAHMGIMEWMGRIETRQCSPFTDSSAFDVATLGDDIAKFLEEQ